MGKNVDLFNLLFFIYGFRRNLEWVLVAVLGLYLRLFQLDLEMLELGIAF